MMDQISSMDFYVWGSRGYSFFFIPVKYFIFEGSFFMFSIEKESGLQCFIVFISRLLVSKGRRSKSARLDQGLASCL